MTRFKLHIEHTEYWFWVIVHDTVEEMRTAGDKHDLETGAARPIRGAGDETGYFGRALGITHKFERIRYAQDGTYVNHPNNGIIRLCAPHVSTRNVAHELIHAVAWCWKLKYGHSIGRKDANGWREERFAYIYGDTLRELTKIMYKKGLWS